MSTSIAEVSNGSMLASMLEQVQALRRETGLSTRKPQDEADEDEEEEEPISFSPVPATGTGIGKSGFRAWVSLAKPRHRPHAKQRGGNNTAPHDVRAPILTAPMFELCGEGDRKTGYVVDRDFYIDWQDDQCKSPSARAETPTPSAKDGEGFEHPVTLPSASSAATPTEPAKGQLEIGVPPPLPHGYQLTWSDEFEGKTLDLTKWEHEVNCLGGGNNEEQCYVAHDDVAKVEGGYLTLQAYHAPEGYALMPTDRCNADADSVSRGACSNRKMVRSARIHTKGAKWKYGRFEMKAKIPVGNFLWPAFWMLPADYAYGKWAASGEFDIMESRGQKPDEVGHALHYGAAWPNNVYSNQQYIQDDLSSKFMVYGMDWDAKAIRFFVNNRYTYQVDTSRNWTSPTLPVSTNGSPYHSPGQPWDQEFIMLLNLAVGGNFFPGAKYNSEADPKTWKQPFIIDYVRVYQSPKSASDRQERYRY